MPSSEAGLRPAGLRRGGHLPGGRWAARWVCGPDLRTVRPAGTGDWLLLVTIGGQGVFRSGPHCLPMVAGQVVCIAPGTPEDYGTERTVGRWEQYWVHLQPRPHWLPWLRLPPAMPGVGSLHLAPPVEAEVRRCLDTACAHAGRPDSTGRALGLAAIEEALIRIDADNPQARSGDDARLQQAVALIAQRYPQALSNIAIARAVGCSPWQLARLFRARAGASVRDYIERVRLDAAADLLLRTALPVQAVAERCGFPDPFHFSTRFRRAFGEAPSRWRQGSQAST